LTAIPATSQIDSKSEQTWAEIISIDLPSDGSCKTIARERFAVPFDTPTVAFNKQPVEERARNAIAETRQHPIIIADLMDGMTAAIMPDARDPAATFITRLKGSVER
jgi:hypothetical protein